MQWNLQPAYVYMGYKFRAVEAMKLLDFGISHTMKHCTATAKDIQHYLINHLVQYSPPE